MNKTSIEWCDYTWNPVTGCYHACSYCYAERIANRFKAKDYSGWNASVYPSPQDKSVQICEFSPSDPRYPEKTVFPYGFMPTLYHGRLGDPQKIKKPSRIFVVSMGDLFGEWVPDEWIKQVFEACNRAPWHTYLFLTKNGSRYEQLGLLPNNVNFWYGTTRTGVNKELERGASDHGNTFLSLEPLLAPLDDGTLNAIELWDWIIIGAQTGPGAVRPKPEWVQSIIDQCRDAGVPLFLKDNLNWPEKIQEFPEVGV